MYWFCKCQVVRDCPPPYNLCCCKCCEDPIFKPCYGCCKAVCPCCNEQDTGDQLPTCYELCSCCVPPNKWSMITKRGNGDRKKVGELLKVLAPNLSESGNEKISEILCDDKEYK